jgi:hypothetical protein
MVSADNWLQTSLGDLIAEKTLKGLTDSQIATYLDGMNGKVALTKTWEKEDWATYKETLYDKLEDNAIAI